MVGLRLKESRRKMLVELTPIQRRVATRFARLLHDLSSEPVATHALVVRRYNAILEEADAEVERYAAAGQP